MPSSQRISENLSHREIFIVRAVDSRNHCKAHLGSYVEAHEDRLLTNTQHLQTFPGVYLGPTGNMQGTLKVFDLKNSVIKKPQTITEFPIPDRFITLIDKCSKRSSREDTQSR